MLNISVVSRAACGVAFAGAAIVGFTAAPAEAAPAEAATAVAAPRAATPTATPALAEPEHSEPLRPLPPVRVPSATTPGSSIREPSGCASLHERLDVLEGQWQSAADDGDYFAANGLRVEYTNVAASYYQCMYAGNIVSINPLGSSALR